MEIPAENKLRKDMGENNNKSVQKYWEVYQIEKIAW